jgi:hypothetical protein
MNWGFSRCWELKHPDRNGQDFGGLLGNSPLITDSKESLDLPSQGEAFCLCE